MPGRFQYVGHHTDDDQKKAYSRVSCPWPCCSSLKSNFLHEWSATLNADIHIYNIYLYIQPISVPVKGASLISSPVRFKLSNGRNMKSPGFKRRYRNIILWRCGPLFRERGKWKAQKVCAVIRATRNGGGSGGGGSGGGGGGGAGASVCPADSCPCVWMIVSPSSRPAIPFCWVFYTR